MNLKNPKAFLEEHYIHEVNMLRQVFLHHQKVDNQIFKNALYDSFCIHARALWDFFNSAKARGNDVIAKHFAPNWDSGISNVGRLDSSLRDAINKQVAHLTETRENATRIDDDIMKKIHDALVTDHENFKSQIDQNYQSSFGGEIKEPTKVHIPAQPGQANVAIYSSSVTQSS
jgi:hypothetical protein